MSCRFNAPECCFPLTFIHAYLFFTNTRSLSFEASSLVFQKGILCCKDAQFID